MKEPFFGKLFNEFKRLTSYMNECLPECLQKPPAVRLGTVEAPSGMVRYHAAFDDV